MQTITPYFYDYHVSARTGVLPITTNDVADWIKLDREEVVDELVDYFDLLIESAVLFAEQYTRRILYPSTVVCYLDEFRCGQVYDLRISPLNSITSIQYLSSGVLTAFDSSKYYTANTRRWSRLSLTAGEEWPVTDEVMQSVTLTASAGYTTLPKNLKAAILGYIARMYSNRGDCVDYNKVNLPTDTKIIFEMYKIKDLFTRI
jgi:uncharacterized phiE125 gp8 family phage protein